MKNHSSRRAAKGGGTQFRSPSMYKANKAESAKHFKQQVFVKGRKKVE
ncbi:hypothetical protein HY477_01400 [Candidatus Uhrbacteria bacterium]|nr:hypothetical protein [Candidatus Uhrbacteria bacterium]